MTNQRGYQLPPNSGIDPDQFDYAVNRLKWKPEDVVKDPQAAAKAVNDDLRRMGVAPYGGMAESPPKAPQPQYDLSKLSKEEARQLAAEVEDKGSITEAIKEIQRQPKPQYDFEGLSREERRVIGAGAEDFGAVSKTPEEDTTFLPGDDTFNLGSFTVPTDDEIAGGVITGPGTPNVREYNAAQEKRLQDLLKDPDTPWQLREAYEEGGIDTYNEMVVKLFPLVGASQLGGKPGSTQIEIKPWLNERTGETITEAEYQALGTSIKADEYVRTREGLKQYADREAAAIQRLLGLSPEAAKIVAAAGLVTKFVPGGYDDLIFYTALGLVAAGAVIANASKGELAKLPVALKQAYRDWRQNSKRDATTDDVIVTTEGGKALTLTKAMEQLKSPISTQLIPPEQVKTTTGIRDLTPPLVATFNESLTVPEIARIQEALEVTPGITGMYLPTPKIDKTDITKRYGGLILAEAQAQSTINRLTDTLPINWNETLAKAQNDKRIRDAFLVGSEALTSLEAQQQGTRTRSQARLLPSEILDRQRDYLRQLEARSAAVPNYQGLNYQRAKENWLNEMARVAEIQADSEVAGYLESLWRDLLVLESAKRSYVESFNLQPIKGNKLGSAAAIAALTATVPNIRTLQAKATATASNVFAQKGISAKAINEINGQIQALVKGDLKTITRQQALKQTQQKELTQQLTKVMAKTAVQTAVRTKAQAKALEKVQAQVKTKTATAEAAGEFTRPLERAAADVAELADTMTDKISRGGKIPPPPPPLKLKGQGKDSKDTVFPPGTIAQKQGFGWWVIPPPKSGVNPSFTRKKPPEAVLRHKTGKPKKTTQLIRGDAQPVESADMGIMDIEYYGLQRRRPGAGRVRFTRDMRQQTTGEVRLGRQNANRRVKVRGLKTRQPLFLTRGGGLTRKHK